VFERHCPSGAISSLVVSHASSSDCCCRPSTYDQSPRAAPRKPDPKRNQQVAALFGRGSHLTAIDNTQQ